MWSEFENWLFQFSRDEKKFFLMKICPEWQKVSQSLQQNDSIFLSKLNVKLAGKFSLNFPKKDLNDFSALNWFAREF